MSENVPQQPRIAQCDARKDKNTLWVHLTGNSTPSTGATEH